MTCYLYSYLCSFDLRVRPTYNSCLFSFSQVSFLCCKHEWHTKAGVFTTRCKGLTTGSCMLLPVSGVCRLFRLRIRDNFVFPTSCLQQVKNFHCRSHICWRSLNISIFCLRFSRVRGTVFCDSGYHTNKYIGITYLVGWKLNSKQVQYQWMV